MAKRFIDNEIFRKGIVRGLPAPQKILWFYLFCECNIAGIWNVDCDIMSVYLGRKVTIDEIKKSLAQKVIFFDNDTKLFIPEFITFQYGELRENNNAHISVIRDLKKYNFLDINNQIIEPLTRPCAGSMDMDKDKDKEMDKGKRGVQGGEYSAESVTWRDSLEIYLNLTRQAYYSLINDETFLRDRQELHPNVNLKLTLKKMCVDYWGTAQGWENKKKGKSKNIDMRQTLINGLSQPQNKVYNDKATNNNGKNPTGFSPDFKEKLNGFLGGQAYDGGLY